PGRADLGVDGANSNLRARICPGAVYFLGVRSDSARDETHQERSAGRGAPVLESPEVCHLHHRDRAAGGQSACVRSCPEPKQTGLASADCDAVNLHGKPLPARRLSRRSKCAGRSLEHASAVEVTMHKISSRSEELVATLQTCVHAWLNSSARS